MNKFNRVHFLLLFVACLFVATTVTPFKREKVRSRNHISNAFNKPNPQFAMNEFASESSEQQETPEGAATPITTQQEETLQLDQPAIDQPTLSIGDQIKKEVDSKLREAQDSMREARIAAGLDPDIFNQPEEDEGQVESINGASINSIELQEQSLPLASDDNAPKNARAVILPPALEEKGPEQGIPYSDPDLDLPIEFQTNKETDTQKETIEQAQEALKKLEEEKGEERIEFNFENADLKNLITYIESLYDLNFITDESISPITKKNAKAVKGNKISFKTNEPLTRQQAWNLFTTFLEIAGFSVVPTGDPAIYRIETLPNARKSPIPAYIGVDASTLPDNDELIRYVYFIKNGTLESIIPVIDSLRSHDAPLLQLKAQKAFILTDKAYNVKTLMEIVKELDHVTMPQSMSVLKLRQADAQEVKKLYEALLAPDQKTQPRVFGPRRPETPNYFPEDTRIIAEPRTNSLILLGAKDSIKKIEDFITKYVDVDLDQPYSPLYVYQLRYADAVTVADIMREVTRFGADTPVGKVGGVRSGDKYLREMAFTPEKATNRIIIKGDYEDYLRAKEIIAKLDEPQPQVAIEILILNIKNTGSKQLGAQARSKASSSGLFGTNIKWQTSGLNVNGNPSGIVEQGGAVPGVQRLLGNLLNLVNPMSAGNSILTLGQDIYGVWGIFQALETVTNLEIVSNPFLMATNKTKARVSLGETRRVVTSTIAGSTGTINSQSDEPASLTVEITPQINSDGMISLDFTVDITDFTNQTDFTSATKTVKKIVSKTIVADQEVLALGGLIRNVIKNTESKVPILGDIPLFGWLFKNRNKSADKENLLILVSTRIVRPEKTNLGDSFTHERVDDYRSSIDEIVNQTDSKDPIHRLFFSDDKIDTTVEEFIFDRRREGSTGNQAMKKKRQTRRDRRKAAKEARKKERAKKEPIKIEQIAIDAPRIAFNQKAPVGTGTNTTKGLRT